MVTESTQAQQQDYLLAQGNLTESTRQALVTAAATNDAAAHRLASDNRQRVARKAQVFLDTDARSKHDLPPIDSPTLGRIVHRRPRVQLPGGQPQAALNPSVLERVDVIEQEYVTRTN
eukprot:COSAG06_NODE_690_length_13054_cov_5.226476_4_plen_118_part_00